jgi:hypothetical protein
MMKLKIGLFHRASLENEKTAEICEIFSGFFNECKH